MEEDVDVWGDCARYNHGIRAKWLNDISINVKIYLSKNQGTRKLTTEKNIELKHFDTFNYLLVHKKVIGIL